MIADDIAAALPEMRAHAESLMTLTVTPQIPGGTDADGFPAFTPAAPHRAKVQSGAQSGNDGSTRYVMVGKVEVPVVEGGLHIPLAAPVPVASEQEGVGWEYVVTAVGPLDDPALLGRRYRAVNAPVKSHATARRLDVIEVK